MKKPRFYRWRWLLSLLLGAGTWWLMDWWLGPKEYLHLTYPISSDPDPSLQNSKVPQMEAPGERNFYRYHARILDTAGKYLYIEQVTGPGKLHYEVIDLRSRQKLARHEFEENSITGGKLEEYPTKANSDGIVHFVENTFYQKPRDPEKQIIKNGNVTFEVLEDGPIVFGRPSSPAIWEWDVIRNETRLLRQHPPEFTVVISQDGSTLLEVEHATPFMPSLFVPQSLVSVLSGVVECRLHCNDLAVMRIYTLPDIQLRSTVILPWFERQSGAELSSDGRYLIVPDTGTLDGFSSPTHITQHSYHGAVQGGRGFVSASDFNVSYPIGVRIYETDSGRLWWQSKDHSAVFTRCSAFTPLVRCLPMSIGPQERSELLLHLPSRKEFSSMASNSIEALDESHVQFTQTRLKGNDLVNEIHVVDKTGHSQMITRCSDNHLQLIPYAKQYLEWDIHPQSLLATVADWFHSHQWLMDWQPAVSFEICMADYQKNRILWSRRLQDDPAITITDHWLLMTQADKLMFHVSIYALPFPSWSPWWPRLAGFVIFLLTLFLLRHRRPKLT